MLNYDMETSTTDYKKQIEVHAIDYFKDLHVGMPPRMIARTISFFEFSLSKEELVDNDDDEITHSEAMPFSIDWLIDLKPIFFGVASIYGTRPIKLFTSKAEPDKYSISYVGYNGDVHACYVSLKKLFGFAKEIRQQYIDSLNKRMKDSTKKERADEFMYDWIEEMASYLRPTALTGDDFSHLDEYIANTFRTMEERRQCDKLVVDFLRIIEKGDDKMTCKDVMDRYLEKTGHSLKELQQQNEELESVPLLEEWSEYS